ncbi:MAG: hypothetical protein J3R72DRAFT_454753 [Linnemannia gamsii]|nr:MAG: hypothetical protein J3R72DRAFT_454753 [Linnemannia gamsii]
MLLLLLLLLSSTQPFLVMNAILIRLHSFSQLFIFHDIPSPLPFPLSQYFFLLFLSPCVVDRRLCTIASCGVQWAISLLSCLSSLLCTLPLSLF